MLLYAGTLGMAHGLETVLLAAERLRDRGEVVFLLIGEGAEREQLLERSRELRLTNVRYLGKQPRERVPVLPGGGGCVLWCPCAEARSSKRLSPPRCLRQWLPQNP